jgi:hypothetical protein
MKNSKPLGVLKVIYKGETNFYLINQQVSQKQIDDTVNMILRGYPHDVEIDYEEERDVSRLI